MRGLSRSARFSKGGTKKEMKKPAEDRRKPNSPWGTARKDDVPIPRAGSIRIVEVLDPDRRGAQEFNKLHSYDAASDSRRSWTLGPRARHRENRHRVDRVFIGIVQQRSHRDLRRARDRALLLAAQRAMSQHCRAGRRPRKAAGRSAKGLNAISRRRLRLRARGCSMCCYDATGFCARRGVLRCDL